MNDYRIAKAVLDDAAEMRQCARDAYRVYTERMGKEPGPMIDDYEYRIRNNSAYIIKDDNRVIAILVLIIDEQRCLLDNVAVHPAASGKGLGRKLVEFAEQTAAKNGFKQIQLYTHQQMTENIAMYERWGYREIRRVREKGFDRVYMSKAV